MKKYTTIFSMGSVGNNNPASVWRNFDDALASNVQKGYVPAGDIQLSLSSNAIAVAMLMSIDVQSDKE